MMSSAFTCSLLIAKLSEEYNTTLCSTFQCYNFCSRIHYCSPVQCCSSCSYIYFYIIQQLLVSPTLQYRSLVIFNPTPIFYITAHDFFDVSLFFFVVLHYFCLFRPFTLCVVPVYLVQLQTAPCVFPCSASVYHFQNLFSPTVYVYIVELYLFVIPLLYRITVCYVVHFFFIFSLITRLCIDIFIFFEDSIFSLSAFVYFHFLTF